MSRTKRTLLAVLSRYVGMVVSAIISFVVVPITLKYVSKADYGLWVAMGEVLGYLAVLDFGVGAAVTRLAARLREDRETTQLSRLLSTAFCVNSVFSLLFILVGVELLTVLPHWRAIPADRFPLAKALFLIMIARGAVMFPVRVAANILVGLQMQVAVNLLNVAGTILSPVIYVVMLRHGAGIVALPIGMLSATFLTSVPTFLILKRVVSSLKLSLRLVTWEEARHLFSWSFLFFLNNVAVLVIYYTDNIVVASQVNLVAVSRFSLTSTLLLYWQAFILTVSESAMPGAVELAKRGEIDTLRSVFLVIMRNTMGGCFCIALTMGMANQAFVRLWVGNGVYGGDVLTAVFAVILLHRTAMGVYSMAVIATGRIRGVVVMSVIEAALNLGLSLYFAKTMGMLGVALGTTTAGLLTSGWYVPMVVMQELHMALWDYLKRCWMQPFAATAVGFLAAYLLRGAFYVHTWFELCLFGAAVGLVYVSIFVTLEFRRGDWREYAGSLKMPALLDR
jgi:O-antigen/teichoic acid export membrane protein